MFSAFSLRASAAIVAVLLISASTASASTPSSASGTFGPTGAPAGVDIRTAGDNKIVTLTARPGAFTGTFTGTYSEDLRIVIHDASTDHPATNFSTIVWCQCTVAGRTGTMTMKVDGTGGATSFTAYWRIIASGGGLEGLHGEGTLGAPPPTYTGQFHFD